MFSVCTKLHFAEARQKAACVPPASKAEEAVFGGGGENNNIQIGRKGQVHKADPSYPCLTSINWDEKVSFQNTSNTLSFESFQQKGKAKTLKDHTPGVCLFVLSSGKSSLIDCGKGESSAQLMGESPC